MRGLAVNLGRAFLIGAPLLLPLMPQTHAPEPQAEQARPRRSSGQDEKPIKLSADLVTVITSVTDASGGHANSLSKTDFEVFEDEVRQDIAGFYREGQLPLRMVFLFDVSGSIRHRFDFEQRAAAQFLRQVMKPEDQVAIMSVSLEPRFEVQFTSSVDELIGALGKLKPGGATALYSAVGDAARYLRPAEGRHVIVVLSDGVDNASGITLAQAMADVQRADAVIYAVHSTGVAPSANVQDLAGESALRLMGDETGGRAFFPPIHEDPKKEARELEDIYRRISAEIRAQYVLTYYSNNGARPGNFRTVKVQVRRPGLQARARRGYYTSKE
jgi:Ca-activated chloride channel family protein